MAQHDYVIANGTGAAVRSDLNSALAAIVSNNSGATAPSPTYAYQLWADTTTNLLKLRNSANSAWITVGDLTAANLGLATLASPTFTGTVGVPLGSAASPTIFLTGDTNTGIYSPGADQFAITTGGTGRLFVDSSGRVGLGTSSPAYQLVVEGSSPWLQLKQSATNTGSSRLLFADGDSAFAGQIIYDHGNNSLSANTNGNTAITIDSSQRVGIGVTAPGYPLEIRGSSGDGNLVVGNTSGPALQCGYSTGGTVAYLQGYNTTSSAFIDLNVNGSTVRFGTGSGATERARIDSSGRLLIGTSSSLHSGDSLQVVADNTNCFGLYSGRNDIYGPRIDIVKARGSTGSPTTVSNGDQLGNILFSGYSGGYVTGASIEAYVDAAVSGTEMPSRLVFSTTADGASSPTERMRIANDGTVYVGTTSKTGEGVALEDTSNGGRLYIGRSNADSVAEFQYSGTRVGQINVTSSSTSYVTSSDYRLKENIVPLTGAADRLNQLQVHRFNFIADSETTVDGFLAHEAQAVVPECVTGEKDAVDDDGKPVYQGIDQSKLVPLLTAALQEALAEIESLKARVTALEP